MSETLRNFMQLGRNPLKVYALEFPDPKIPATMRSKKSLLGFCFNLDSSSFDLQEGGFARCFNLLHKEGELSC